VQVVIVETASISAAKAAGNWMPLAVGGLVAVWNTAYAKRGRRAAGLADKAPQARAGATPPAVRR
jgi:hypothetical protein